MYNQSRRILNSDKNSPQKLTLPSRGNVRDLTSGSISGSIWFLALPMMATNFLHTMFHMMDMIFLGRLGPNAIAAVSVSGAIMMIPFSIAMGVATATGAMVARHYGAGDVRKASRVAMQSLTAATLLGLAITLLAVPAARSLINLFGVEPDVLGLGTSYLRILLFGSVLMTLQFISGGILQAVGDARTAMFIVGGSALLNIIFDPLLIFGIWVFPRWEVDGAAVGTVAARLIGTIVALAVLTMKRSHLCIQPRYVGLKRAFVVRLIRIGLPSSLQTLIRSTAGIVMMGIVADYGTLLLATYGVGIRIDMLVLMPGFGLAAAAATLVGQNLGAGKPERAEKSALTAVFYYVLFMLVASTTFYVFAKPIFRVFNDTPEVLDLGKSYMRIIVLSYPLIAVAIVLNRSLMGAGNTLPPMLITLGVLCGVTVPLALLLPRVPWLGPRGLWVAIVSGHFVACLAVATVFKRGKWKRIVL